MRTLNVVDSSPGTNPLLEKTSPMSAIFPSLLRAEASGGLLKRRRSGWMALAAGLTLGLWAAPCRAVELRVVTWNVENGVGAPGTPAFAAVRETLERLAPDVIAFQEVDAQNPVPSHPAHFAELRALLQALGFPTTRSHLATAGDGWQGQAFVAGDFGNSSQCLAVASRHPITRTVQVGRGIAGRRELTRFPLAVTIDPRGTERDVVLIAVHFKQGDTQADEFRRAVEALRVRTFLADTGVSGATDHILVVGDMNEELNEPQTPSFSTTSVTGGHTFGDGSTLPAAYLLGPGLPGSLTYATFPTSGFASIGLSVVAATQTDGRTDRTYTYAGNSRLDYILTGSATRNTGAVRAEVYHSGREPVGDGLPKAPSLPDPTLSLQASDHLPVVVDVALEAKPSLTVTLPAAATAIGFQPGDKPLQGTVSIPSALAAPLMVTIAPFRPAPVRTIPPLVIPAGETSVPFSLELAGSPFAPDRRITLVARAAGHRDGIGTLTTRGTGVAGPLLISQYTETPSGSSPKAIEVMNATAREIDFAAEPLQVLSYASGASAGTPEVLAEFGRLPAGAVVVIGDTATGQHLVAQGLLAATGSAIAAAQTNTVFTDTGEPDGRAVYIKRGFLFNGDDALEVRLNSRRCDVFGTIGQDPGTAWSGGGVSTTNQNLSRRRTASTPAAGWSQPGLVFETVGTTMATALVGFGVAPVLDDPYAEWAATRGLAGTSAAIDADPDGNGVPNGVEFVFGDGAGALLRALEPSPGRWQWQAGPQVRNRLGAVRWGLATAGSLDGWHTQWEETASLAPPPGDFRPLTLTLPATDQPAGLARVFVVRP
jgi:endonuclease/exonuclease/phosphatase family metal-dependent hydrolase